MTPLFKPLKQNGTSFYCFPSSSADISSAYMNSNYKMYFSKYVLLNLPKQNLTSSTGLVQWDFDNSFIKSTNSNPATSYKDQLIESLRNYVANHEVTIKESKLNSTEYFYNNNEITTTTEKIFWKWCRKLNIVDFELATDGDEYFGNLSEFERANLNDDSYFPELLWRERQIIEWSTISFYETNNPSFVNKLEIQYEGVTNFRIGDKVNFSNVTNSTIILNISTNNNGLQINNSVLEVLYVVSSTPTSGQKVIFDVTCTLNNELETTGITKLSYNKLVQYIGEVNGINNVQESNKSYTEVYAHISDNTGQTPDILFRTIADTNYKPNMVYPILPSQYQPEIIGSELFSSPIVNTPQNYPGSYFGQFDTNDFTYETSTGDSIRRSGEYYGISGDINSPVVNGENIDGVTLDFDSDHYVKMNIIGREVTTFDQFNSMEVNNEPPLDFEFNAILWYYTVEDLQGNTTTNLYGISFVDNPDNNEIQNEIGLRVPTYKKLCANNNQDGTSYAFSLNLNFNINNDNVQDTYNPNNINGLFSFNLYNEAMKRLSSLNESFINIISDNNIIKTEVLNVKQLIYTQTDFNSIKAKISNLESLLNQYQSNQIVSSDSIDVYINSSTNAPTIELRTTDTSYHSINNVNTTDLYNINGIIPLNIAVPKNKNFLINVVNNDNTLLSLPNNDNLSILLTQDLSYKQTLEIIISGASNSTENKELDIYINYNNGSGTLIETPLITNIDLPVFYNSQSQISNISKRWNSFEFNVDYSKDIKIIANNILQLSFQESPQLVFNSIKSGDIINIENFSVGTASSIDFSGQYKILTVSATNSSINIDMSINTMIFNYSLNKTLPIIFNGSSYLLNNKLFISINKGIKYKITRISENDLSSIQDRYLIEKIFIK